jgi:methyl-accepting chemotaxis protein
MSFAETIFKPASVVMNRLSFARKIAVIGLLFLVPILGVTTLLFRKYGDEIRSARRERTGVEMIRPVKDLLEELILHREAQRQFLADHEGAPLNSLETKIDLAFARLDALDQDFGADFATRQSYGQLKSEWLGLKQSVRSASAADGAQAHHQVINTLTTFATTVADGSGLSLDPDLDSYYLMDAAVFRVPTLVENLANLRRLAVDAAETGKVSAEDRTSMVVLEHLLELDDASIEGDLSKVLAYRPALKAELGPPQAAAFDALRHFRTTTTSKLLAPGQPKLDPLG